MLHKTLHLPTQNEPICPVMWKADGVCLIDQRQLPHSLQYLQYYEVSELAKAITDMVVRGAPAIGITAAYGVVLAARNAYTESPDDWRERIQVDLAMLASSRPTAVNLEWALHRMQNQFSKITASPEPILLKEAQAIHQEDIAANMQMGEFGAALIDGASEVLTHCNAGALATGGFGTALGVIRTAHAQGKIKRVYACETRPRLQGTKLTAWELEQTGIVTTLLADSAACYLLKERPIKWVIVGADRIASNGDVANKIGTYALAVLARHHGACVMVVAPTSTIDLNTKCGQDICIEHRDASEILHFSEHRIASNQSLAWNPAFDVTPAELVDVIVTEKGVAHPPDSSGIKALLSYSS